MGMGRRCLVSEQRCRVGEWRFSWEGKGYVNQESCLSGHLRTSPAIPFNVPIDKPRSIVTFIEWDDFSSHAFVTSSHPLSTCLNSTNHFSFPFASTSLHLLAKSLICSSPLSGLNSLSASSS